MSLHESFSLAANTYEAAADFQRSVGFDLCQRLNIDVPHRSIVDVGCGTGFFMPHLQAFYPDAALCGLDIAQGMLGYARAHYDHDVLCADAQNMPFQSKSIDLLYSNLVFQWCDSLASAFQEARRVLRLKGRFCFSMLSQHSLPELRDSWLSVGACDELMQFHSADFVKESLFKAGFYHVDMQLKTYVDYYDRVVDFLRSFKKIGAKNQAINRPRGLCSPAKLSQLALAYERFRDHEKRLPATYEVLLVEAY